MLDLAEKERLVRRIDELSRKLGIEPVYPLSLGLYVHDPRKGLVLSRQEAAHSWTRNAWNLLMCFFMDGGAVGEAFEAGTLTAKSVDGTIHSSASKGYYAGAGLVGHYGICDFEGTGGFGIMVGDGDTAFDPDQYALASKIAHGSGAGELSHGAMDRPSRLYHNMDCDPRRTVQPYEWRVTATRSFTNNSGAAITVRETGLYWYGCLFNGTHTTFMTARDVLSTPVEVPNLGVLTVSYRMDFDFEPLDSIGYLYPYCY